MQLLGGVEILPSDLRTFLAVDFYNHESKHTDPTEGFEANYETLFRFRNIVDDFYIRYFEQQTVLVDVFALPIASINSMMPSGALKIGSARLALQVGLDGDRSF